MTARTKEAAVLADCTQAALGYRFAQTWQQAYVRRVTSMVVQSRPRSVVWLCGQARGAVA